MSRIGNQPVLIPAGVTVIVDKRLVTITGPKGNLTLALPQKINVKVEEDKVIVTRLTEDKKTKACHGTIRAHINNMIAGVQNLWKKELEIRGTGYKASVNGNKLIVTAGYIHPVEVTAPEGIIFSVAEDTKITVSGINKVIVGQIASNIRKIRKPEPYKGKGVRYLNEFIKLKAGKTAKA